MTIDVLAKFRPYLDNVVVKQTNGLSQVSLFPPELTLAIQALFARTDQGKASANETVAVAVIKEALEMFGLAVPGPPNAPGGKGEATSGAANNAAEGEDKSEELESKGEPRVHRANAKREHVLPSVASSSLDLHEADMRRCVADLLDAMPELAERGCLERAGFSQRASGAIEAKVFASASSERLSPAEITRVLKDWLDPVSWSEMRPHLVTIARNATENQFSLDAILDGDSPWWHGAMAMLGSPEIRLQRKGMMMAKWVGLGGVVDMYKAAQAVRRERDSAERGASGSAVEPSTLTAAQRQELADVVGQLGMGNAEATMEETVLRDVHEVAEIIEAFVVSGSNRADVTAELEEVCLVGHTLHLSNLDIDTLRGVPAAPNAGYVHNSFEK